MLGHAPKVLAQVEMPESCSTGLEHYQAGDYETALEYFEQCVKADKKNAIARYNRGKALDALGQSNKALGDFKKAIKLDPAFIQPYYALAEYQLVQEEFDKATEWMTEAIEKNPHNPYTYNFRGWILLTAGKNNAAFKDFDYAIHLNPQYASAYNNRGSARYYMQDLAMASEKDLLLAKEDYLKALELQPGLNYVHRNLGCIYIYLNDFDTAHYYLNKALEEQPNDPMIYYFHGLIYQKQGVFKQALDEYDKAIDAFETLGGAWFQKGEIYYFQKNLKAARYNYKKCLELSPDYGARASYALAKVEARDFDKARMMEYLELAREEGYFIPLQRHQEFLNEKVFDPFRKDPAFKEFLDSIRK